MLAELQTADAATRFGATYSDLVALEEERIQKSEMWICRQRCFPWLNEAERG